MALLRAGYTVIEMWECEWDRLVDNEPAVSQFLRSLDLVPPLEPREAFFGGRTGAVALQAVAGEGEEIRYVDVTSLYPWVNKNCPYPIGHPQIITQPVDQSLGSPRWTFFPLLACSTPSCPCAAVTNSPFLCVAPESRRSRPNPCCIALTTAIIRTWIGCHAVLGAPPSWSKPWKRGTPWSRSTKSGIFPPEQCRTSLFADYVNTRLKLKQESAGWPSWCQTVEQKREYILRYKEREGIRLDIDSIAKNPGRKATAKLMLNRYPFHFFFFMFSSHPFSKFLFSIVSGANLVSGSTNPLPSPSRTLPICSV